jgi:chromosomal replication initiation ATPase DnaA
MENPLKKLKAGVILGDKRFAEKTLQRLKRENRNKKGIAYRRSLNQPFDNGVILETVCRYFHVEKKEILYRKNPKYTNITIYLLKRFTGLSNERIGNLFGNLSYHSISKRKTRFVQSLKKDPILRKKVEEIIKKIKMSNVEP